MCVEHQICCLWRTPKSRELNTCGRYDHFGFTKQNGLCAEETETTTSPSVRIFFFFSIRCCPRTFKRMMMQEQVLPETSSSSSHFCMNRANNSRTTTATPGPVHLSKILRSSAVALCKTRKNLFFPLNQRGLSYIYMQNMEKQLHGKKWTTGVQT